MLSDLRNYRYYIPRPHENLNELPAPGSIAEAEAGTEFTMEAPVRQTSRFILSVENPLPSDIPITMGSIGKPEEWYTCDCDEVRVNELAPMSGNAEGQFEVEFRPLKPTDGTRDHLITLMSTELCFLWVNTETIEVGIIIAKEVPTDKCIK